MYKYILILSLIFIGYSGFSQADTLVKVCSKYLNPPFISDGQQYQTILNGEELAEFHVTFFGGSTYRIIGCSGLNDGNLIINLYDSKRNLLYTNNIHENSPYWDFKFSYTMDCIIEAKLDNKNLESGFAIILIGFKQK
ncbi:MAG: hypothetical protein SNJ71_03040 [Bacteroidales bacterium]